MKYSGQEKISVIVIIYNVELYLEECLNSITKQTYENLEIILVDDGSTDKSGMICDRFADQDDRVTVIHKDNGGLVSARQAGIKAVHGEYVAFVDGDDWVDIEMYEKLYLVLKVFRTDVVTSGIIREFINSSQYDKDRLAEGYYNKCMLENDIYANMMFSVKNCSCLIDPSLCNKLFRTGIIKYALLQVNKDIFYLGEDAAAVYPCLLEAKSIYVTTFCLYHHRQIVKKKASSYKREKVFERLGIFYKSLKEIFCNTNYSSIMLPQLNGYYLNLLKIVVDENIGVDMHLFIKYIITCERKKETLIYQMPTQSLREYRNIVLYGAGNVGMQYYSQLREAGIKIVLWVDKKYELYRDSGVPVSSARDILDVDYDLIVIATKFEKVAVSIKEELNAQGISNKKVKWIPPIENN